MTNTKEHFSGNELGKQGWLVRKPVSLIYLGLFTHFINLSATFILDDLVSTILAKKNKTGLCPPMLCLLFVILTLSDVLLIDNKIKVLVNQKYLQKRVGFPILPNITSDQVWCRNWEKNTFCVECIFCSNFPFLSFWSILFSHPIEVEIFCKIT